MPMPRTTKRRIIAADSEGTGLDVYHGAQPFFITVCREDYTQVFWEWDVDPLTRKVCIPQDDVQEIRRVFDEADAVVTQNGKFDAANLERSGVLERWPWEKNDDCLVAGHLLASNHSHNLTDMCVDYIGQDILHYEVALKAACHEARRLVRRQFPEWRIATEDLPEMPSVEGGKEDKKKRGQDVESPWKADTWLLRLLAKTLKYPNGGCSVVNMLDKSALYDVRVDRASKWGNPFEIGPTCTREQSVAKFREWFPQQKHLVDALGELDGKVLGCWCAPKKCHACVLAEEVNKRAHPWWTLLRDYSNADSSHTLALWLAMEHLLKQQGMWNIYCERRKLPRLANLLQEYGATLNRSSLYSMRDRFADSQRQESDECVSIAANYTVKSCVRCGRLLGESEFEGDKRCECAEKRQATEGPYTLDLPKGNSNDNLRSFVFSVLKLDKVYDPKGKSGAPCLNSKLAIPHYLETLPAESDGFKFISSLTDRASFTTAISYLNNYERFWLPVPGQEGWFRVHANGNATGTNHLRWSFSKPNTSNVGKKQSECRRCEGEGCKLCNGTGLGRTSLREPFGPAPGREWWSMDAKNIELRIPAYESKQQELIDLFEKFDEPPYYGSEHLLNFSTVYPDVWDEALRYGVWEWDGDKKGERITLKTVGPYCKKKFVDSWYQYCKNGDFAVGYGSMDRDDGMGTADIAFHRPGAQAMLKSRFAKKEALNQHWIAFANKHGYVETIPDKEVDPKRGYQILCTRGKWNKVRPTEPLNYHVSGTAMQWTNRCMVKTQECLDEWNKVNRDYFMTLQVHDQLVFDFPKRADPVKNPKGSNLWRAKELRRLMESCGPPIDIPTPCDLEYHAATWASGVTIA